MIRLAALLAGMGLAASPALAQVVTVDTARGPVEVEPSPQGVVVFDTAAMDTLDALGVPALGVPGNVRLDYLQDFVEGAEVVGTLFEPDFEAVNALAPDLVIVGGRSSEQAEPLSRLAPTLDMTIGAEDLVGDALARLDAYGALFGRQAEADVVAAGLEAKLAQAREAVAGQGSALVLLTNGTKVSAYGQGSRFGWLHSALDLPEAAPGLEVASHGEAVSFEFVRDANPDWLLVVDRAAAIGEDSARAEATLDNALVAETTAWREGHVIYLPAAEAYVAGGGVQALSRTLDEVIAAFGGAAS